MLFFQVDKVGSTNLILSREKAGRSEDALRVTTTVIGSPFSRVRSKKTQIKNCKRKQNNYICAMKYFWLFFSVFLCLLSVYPCSDNEECETIVKTEISKAGNPEKHNHETEQCAPFCTCACCGVPTLQTQYNFTAFKKKFSIPEKKEQLSFYSFIYNKKIILNIWQPPKIS